MHYKFITEYGWLTTAPQRILERARAGRGLTAPPMEHEHKVNDRNGRLTVHWHSRTSDGFVIHFTYLRDCKLLMRYKL